MGRQNSYNLFLQRMKGKGMTIHELSDSYQKLSFAEKHALAESFHKKSRMSPPRKNHITKATRIRVLWLDKEKPHWFEGLCNPTTSSGRNYVKYDDGEKCYHDLSQWKWEILKSSHSKEYDKQDGKYKSDDASVDDAAVDDAAVDDAAVDDAAIGDAAIDDAAFDDDAAKSAAITLLHTKNPRDNKANVIINLIKRGLASNESIVLLAKSISQKMSSDATHNFLAHICEMDNPNHELLASIIFEVI